LQVAYIAGAEFGLAILQDMGSLRKTALDHIGVSGEFPVIAAKNDDLLKRLRGSV
jgi:hypothetical protein